MQFCLTFRARVDVAPKNYVKIAVNHEVLASVLLITHNVQAFSEPPNPQVVSLLASQGSCAPGYGPQHQGSFDSCIYSKLQQIMVSPPNPIVDLSYQKLSPLR